MPIGPGKYDAECTRARSDTKARGVVLIVLDGDRGDGFSCQAPSLATLGLPALLRELADKIEADGRRLLAALRTR